MLSSKQNEYLQNCDHRWNIKVGATGSGKSWLDYAVVIPQRLMAMKGQGAAIILGNTQGTAKRNIIEPMQMIYGNDLVESVKGDNAAKIFGQKVYVLGADKKTSTDRIRGMTIEYAYGDEMTTWNEEVFEMLKSRLRCEHSYFDGTANPEGPRHFVKMFLESGADIYEQRSTIFDNPFLPEKFVENLCKEYEGTVYYRRYILGEWALADGLVYDMFNNDMIVDLNGLEFTPACYVSCDYGTQNATVFLKWKKTTKGAWVLADEYYYSGREKQKQKTDSEYAADIKAFVGTDRPKAVIVDPSAASFIAELRKKGFPVMKAGNNVLDGIRETAAALNTNKIYIGNNCKNTLREFDSYAWDNKAVEGGKDAPLKVDDHCMDALRYFVHTVLAVQKATVGDKRKLGVR